MGVASRPVLCVENFLPSLATVTHWGQRCVTKGFARVVALAYQPQGKLYCGCYASNSAGFEKQQKFGGIVMLTEIEVETTGYVWGHNGEPVTEAELEQLFDDDLDDLYGEVHIADSVLWASDVLKETDPTGYRCSMWDFADSCDELMGEEEYREAYGEEEEEEV